MGKTKKSPSERVVAASEFQHKTSGINQLLQADFTCIEGIGWAWCDLSTVLDDYSRHIVSTARQGIALQWARGAYAGLRRH